MPRKADRRAAIERRLDGVGDAVRAEVMRFVEIFLLGQGAWDALTSDIGAGCVRGEFDPDASVTWATRTGDPQMSEDGRVEYQQKTHELARRSAVWPQAGYMRFTSRVDYPGQFSYPADDYEEPYTLAKAWSVSRSRDRVRAIDAWREQTPTHLLELLHQLPEIRKGWIRRRFYRVVAEELVAAALHPSRAHARWEALRVFEE